MKLSLNQRKEFWQKVRRILREEWDPIGISNSGPDDEYDGYVPSIFNLLVGDASKEKISEMLLHHANVNMGMSTELESHFDAADKLLELRDEYSGK